MYHSHGDIINMMKKVSDLGINLLVSLNKDSLKGEEGFFPQPSGICGRVQKGLAALLIEKCGDVA
jgi:hypothetical protein